MRNWFAVQTRPREESRATFNLRRQGFAVFLPEFLKTRRHARRTEQVRRPFFPNYLFVQIDMSSMPWRAINSTFGVVSLVCGRDHSPTPLPDSVMNALFSRCGADGLMETPLVDDIKKGDPVRFVSGPLAPLDAVFELRNDQDRVTVLLNILGRVTAVKTERKNLEVCA